MLIGLLYDAPSLIPLASEEEAVAAEGSVLQVESIGRALESLGHRTARLIYRGSVPELIGQIDRARPRLVVVSMRGYPSASNRSA